MRRTKKQVSDLISQAQQESELPIDMLYFKLGAAKYYQGKKKTAARAKTNYEKIGREFSEEVIKKLQKALCNSRTKKPKKKYENSDWLTVAVALLADLSNGTIVAVLAILIKKGIVWLCKKKS